MAIMTLRPGSLIYAQRPLWKHYGVYVGDGWVVEYAGDKSQDTVVQCVPYADFERGSHVYVEACGSPYPREEIVARAMRLVGWGRGQYGALRLNCEHIARLIVSGEPRSIQSEAFWEAVRLALASYGRQAKVRQLTAQRRNALRRLTTRGVSA